MNVGRPMMLEKLESRRLLAVDLVIQVAGESEIEQVGDEVTRIVRVFNNGDEIANDILVRSELEAVLDSPTWTSEASHAQFVPGTAGRTYNDESAEFGLSFSSASTLVGDLNGDGFPDFFSAPNLVFGGPGRTSTDNVVRLSPEPLERAVSSLGDINGDGFDDFRTSKAVLFGRANLAELATLEHTILSPEQGFLSDIILHPLGDVNGDGFADIRASDQGQSLNYIVWGAAGFSSSNLARENAADYLSVPFWFQQVAGGDFNNDGLQDLAFDLGSVGLVDKQVTQRIVTIVLRQPDGQFDMESSDSMLHVELPVGIADGDSYASWRLPYVATMGVRNGGDLNMDGIEDLVITVDGGDSDGTASDKGVLGDLGIVAGAMVVLGSQELSENGPIYSVGSDNVLWYPVKAPFGGRRPQVLLEDRNSDGVPDLVMAVDDREYSIFAGPDLASIDFVEHPFRELTVDNGYVLEVPSNLFRFVNSQGEVNSLQATGGGRERRTVIRYFSGTLEPPATQIETGQGDIVARFDLGPGAGRIYTVRGVLKEPGALPVSTVGLNPEEAHRDDTDRSDNIAPRSLDAVYLDVQAQVKSIEHDVVDINVQVTNLGPDVARSVSVLESVSEHLENLTWSVESREFPFEMKEIEDYGVRRSGEFIYFRSPEYLGWNTGRLGDVNGDGFDDFFVANDDGMRLFWGSADFGADGNFAGSAGTAIIKGYWNAVELGDVNDDGFDDFRLEPTGRYSNQSGGGRMRIVYGRAEMPTSLASFDFLNPARLGSSTTDVPNLVGDLNGDGILDQVMDNVIRIGGGLGEITVTGAPDSADAETELLSIGDINDDGFGDLAITRTHRGNSRSFILYGDAGLHQVPTLNVEDLQRIVGATHVLGGEVDVNGDGVHDLLAYTNLDDDSYKPIVFVHYGAFVANADQIDLRELDGTNGLQLTASDIDPLTSSLRETWIAVSDINNDGFDDILLKGGAGNGGILLGAVADGQAKFDLVERVFSPRIARLPSTGSNYAFSFRSSVVGGLDINGDGLEDFVVGDASAASITEDGSSGLAYVIFGREETNRTGTGPITGIIDIAPGSVVTFRIHGVRREPNATDLGTFQLVPSENQFELHPLDSSKELRVSAPVPLTRSAQAIDSGSIDASGDGDFGDVDGDGDLDLFVTVDGGPNQVWLNDGTGEFLDSGQRLGGNASNFYSALGDIDNDGDLDVVTSADVGDAVLLWLNDGTGNFTDSQSIGRSAARAIDVALGDIDADGDLDLFVANDNELPDELWLNESGVFSKSPHRFRSTSSKSVELVDVNLDGRLDVVVGSSQSPSWVYVQHTNSPLLEFFHRKVPVATEHLAAGDLNGDGVPELVSAENGGNRIWRAELEVRSFGNHVEFVSDDQLLGDAVTSHVELADMDADGDLDIIAANWTNDASRIWMNESGRFTLNEQMLDLPLRSEHIAVGDIDQDGDLDLHLATRGAPSPIYYNDAPHYQLGDLNRDGEVQFADFLILSHHFGDLVATPSQGDLDGDGEVSFADFLLLAADFSTATRKSD